MLLTVAYLSSMFKGKRKVSSCCSLVSTLISFWSTSDGSLAFLLPSIGLQEPTRLPWKRWEKAETSNWFSTGSASWSSSWSSWASGSFSSCFWGWNYIIVLSCSGCALTPLRILMLSKESSCSTLALEPLHDFRCRFILLPYCLKQLGHGFLRFPVFVSAKSKSD